MECLEEKETREVTPKIFGSTDVALFGGSFDPPHINHINVAKKVLNSKFLPIDQVWFIPCKKQHSGTGALTHEDHRLEMCRLACGSDTRLEVKDLECRGPDEVGYASKIIRLFEAIYDHNFYYIIGSDMLYEINRWHQFRWIRDNVSFIVVERKDYPPVNLYNIEIKEVLPEVGPPISSTLIRDNIDLDRNWVHLVPDGVAGYIRKEHLYEDPRYEDSRKEAP